jgi:hypothetical protein
MSTLATLIVKLVGDTTDFQRDMEKSTESVSGFHRGIGGLGNVLKGGLMVGAGAAIGAVAGLGAVLVSSVGDAMAAQEITAQLDAVLKSTGGSAGVTKDQVLGLADSLSKVTRFEDDTIVSGENMLLTFTNIGKDVFPDATQAMLDISQAMGKDLPSSAQMLGKALNDPIQGVGALRKIGVQFTDDQEAMIKKLVETGNVMGAQKIILGELNREFGGSAVAAGQTFGGQMDILKNQLGNVKESIGTALLPALSSLATSLGPMLIGAAQGLANFMTTTLIPALQTIFEWIATNLPPAIAALAAFWTDTLQPALATVWSFLQANVIPILSVLVDVWLKALGVEIQLVAAFWTNVLQPALATVWTFIQTNVIPILVILLTWLRDNIPPAIAALANWWTTVLQPAIAAVWSFIQTKIIPLFQSLANLYIAILKKEIELLAAIWKNVLQPALEKIWQFLQDNVIPILVQLAGIVRENIGPALEWLKNNVLDPVAGALGSIGDAISKVISWLDTMAEKLNNIKLPKWLQPGSPTPFELGLLGINAALEDTIHLMDRLSMPNAPVAAAIGYSGARGSEAAPRGGQQWSVTINVQAASGDPRQIGREAEQGMLRAARSLGLR